MKDNSITTLFLLQKTRINKQGKCPIRCRITFNHKRKEFSSGLFIDPIRWNSKKQKAIPTGKENDIINTKISLIKNKIDQAFLFLDVNEKSFDVEDVYLKYVGKTTKSTKTLLEVFELHNNRMEKLVGIEYSNSTYVKFKEVKTHISNFIKFMYHKNDILLESIKINFIQDFDYYLKTEKGHKQITINKSIQRLRKIIKLALAEGYINKDPFLLYTPKKHEKRISYLTQAELSKLENYSFSQTRLKYVADMFIFCCYTGLAFAEMDNLSYKHIIEGIDGNTWIEMYRKKTKSKITVPLLKKPQEIINKYRNEEEHEKILPKISNQKFNSYLKEIADIVGIEKRLTHHMARKTFATTILLYNDVPIEIVSELLGHSSIKITQGHYAKVMKSKVNEHITKLSHKLDKDN